MPILHLLSLTVVFHLAAGLATRVARAPSVAFILHQLVPSLMSIDFSFLQGPSEPVTQMFAWWQGNQTQGN